MDKNDPAWKLADAARESRLKDNPVFLDNALADLSPSARDLARAYALSLTAAAFNENVGHSLALQARLQVRLMEEHVAAQERMGRTLGNLLRRHERQH